MRRAHCCNLPDAIHLQMQQQSVVAGLISISQAAD